MKCLLAVTFASIALNINYGSCPMVEEEITLSVEYNDGTKIYVVKSDENKGELCGAISKENEANEAAIFIGRHASSSEIESQVLMDPLRESLHKGATYVHLRVKGEGPQSSDTESENFRLPRRKKTTERRSVSQSSPVVKDTETDYPLYAYINNNIFLELKLHGDVCSYILKSPPIIENQGITKEFLALHIPDTSVLKSIKDGKVPKSRLLLEDASQHTAKKERDYSIFTRFTVTRRSHIANNS